MVYRCYFINSTCYFYVAVLQMEAFHQLPFISTHSFFDHLLQGSRQHLKFAYVLTVDCLCEHILKLTEISVPKLWLTVTV
jgi:hypothetical protein